MIDRVPPQNIEAEQAVLGAMLISKEAIAESAQILMLFYRFWLIMFHYLL